MARPSQGICFQTKSQDVALEAVELRDEEGDALEVVRALNKVEPQKDCFQTKVPRGDTEAVELLAGFPVPYGDEEGQGVASEVVWTLGKVEHKRTIWVSGVGWVLFLARTLSRWPSTRLPRRRV